MKAVKVLFAVVFMIVFAIDSVADEHSIWMKDLDQAKQIAVTKNKPILVYFTGSDWCMWCMKLDKEVFSKQEFKDYLKENFIPVVIDFPMYQEQSAAIRRKHEKLKAKYAVQGFPTLFLLNPQGKILAKSNYIPGGVSGVKKYLELAKQKME
jgi:thioredoxin-related protein